MAARIPRALVVLSLLLVDGSRVASASEQPPVSTQPRIELFGGYTYSPEFDEYKTGSQAGHGVAVALTVNLRKYLGVVVDADWQSWTDRGDVDQIDPETVGCIAPTSYEYCATYRGDQDISLFYLSFGPRLHVRRGPFTAFGLAAVEVQRSRFSEQDLAYIRTAGGVELDTLPEDTAGAWGFGVGGGADLSLGRRFAVRMAQVNYSFGGFGQGPDRQLRIKAGVVVRFD
jgi:hypothetical protein